MQQPEIRKYLYDILQACDLLIQFSAAKTFEDYHKDALLRSAVERQFEIVGEALNKAIKLDPSLAGEVDHSSRIIAFRNRLIHAYALIADEVVWDVLKTYLPRLREQVQRLLQA
jgi:uncharacterized protein with HEPN domain